MSPNKQNIQIPQGMVHAIDRVMFPLPVGDLVHTLQADQEGRFSTFLKLIYASGLDELLSGKLIKIDIYQYLCKGGHIKGNCDWPNMVIPTIACFCCACIT